MADCIMTSIILKKFLLSAGELDARVWVNWLKTPVRLKHMPHGKFKGQPMEQVRTGYLTWAAKEWTDMQPDLHYTFQCMGYLP
jgi:hypothetical protein